MKVVILAGGKGSRIAEESYNKPKPMVEIGGQPILWHIMKIYAEHGLTDFVILCGYKGYVIKEYFCNYLLHRSNVTIDLVQNQMKFLHTDVEPWKVTLVDTGAETQTGGRLGRARHYIGDDTFCMTYGDGVGNIDISSLIAFHKSGGQKATVTAVRPTARFGALALSENNLVEVFHEKPPSEGGHINGGFFVLEPEVLDLIPGDESIWERAPMETLAQRRELRAFQHDGFWHPMDTVRDRMHLEELWGKGNAPWKIWNDAHTTVVEREEVLSHRPHRL
jgi:glucose-1-phosphate cytidylyltransferase